MSRIVALRSTSTGRSIWRPEYASSWPVSCRGPQRRPRAIQLRVLPFGRSLRQLRHQHLGRHQDDRQQIVEIVRDAARQPADRLGLRRQLTLLLSCLRTSSSCRTGRGCRRAPEQLRHQRIDHAVVGAGFEHTHATVGVGRRHAGDDDRHRAPASGRAASAATLLIEGRPLRQRFDDDQVRRFTNRHRPHVVGPVRDDQTAVTAKRLYSRDAGRALDPSPGWTVEPSLPSQRSHARKEYNTAPQDGS